MANDNPYLNPYLEIPNEAEIQHPESLLHKAAKAIMPTTSPQGLGYLLAGGTLPVDIGMHLAGQNGPNISSQAEEMRTKAVNAAVPPDNSSTQSNPLLRAIENSVTSIPNTFLNTISDPMALGGGMAAGKNAFEKVLNDIPITKTGRLNLFENIAGKVKGAKPMASQEMGEEMAALEAMYPGRGKIDFGGVVKNAVKDPHKAAILEEFPDIANAGEVSLQESQDLINSLKETFPDRIWKGKIKPSETHAMSLAEDLAGAQDAVHPEMAEVIRPKFGVTAEASKKVPNVLQAIAGKREPMARDVQDEAMKVLVGNKDFKKIRTYRTIQGAKKVASGVGKLGAAKEILGTLLH